MNIHATKGDDVRLKVVRMYSRVTVTVMDWKSTYRRQHLIVADVIGWDYQPARDGIGGEKYSVLTITTASGVHTVSDDGEGEGSLSWQLDSILYDLWITSKPGEEYELTAEDAWEAHEREAYGIERG